ncbi:hypothetical protein ABZ234_07900 [Nocardiopsis sp. NPDC006198]|uniref:hypothetical protein n=1 Tax=Nocardiopsis sp. NPDC006198 TaxID=3154472 RepID=UPI0033A8628C
MAKYQLQRPVGDDGAPIIGPNGRPIVIPHFQMPGFAVYDRKVDAQALGALAFLWSFLDTSEGEVSSSVTAADIAARFRVSEQVVMRKGGRKDNPPGLVPRLAQAGALIVGPSRVKIRTCPGCFTEAEVPCPAECTEKRGRKSVKPRFQLSQAPPEGFLYPGAMDRWEYAQPKGIARRLREEGPDSTTPPAERRDQMPYVQVLSWPALDPDMGLRHLGVYVFLAAHSDLSRSRVTTGDWLFRETIADRFGLSVSRVSQITRDLEESRYIAKHGLVHRGDKRHGVTHEPVSYAMRVMPRGGLHYPKALRISEWRDPALITARQEVVRGDQTVSLQFPHTPPDLGIVDNPSYPQEGVRGNKRLGMWELQAGDVETGDLRTHPHTHPRTHPSPSAQQPQPQGGVPHPRDAATDGGENSQAGSGHDAKPPTAPAPDPVLALVERYVPWRMCLKGRDDQRSLARRLRTLLEAGHLAEGELGDVFDGLEQIVKPFGVVSSRLSSVSRLNEHLEVVRRRRAEAAAAAASSTRVPGEGHCYEHNLALMPELFAKYNAPMCVDCEKALDKPQAAVGRGGTDGETPGSSEEEVAEKFRQSLASARTGARSARSEQPPAGGPGGLGAFLKALEPQPEREHCGSCNAEFRTITVQVSSTHVERRRCPRCHWSLTKAG